MDFLKLLWKKWLVIAHAVGNFQAQVLLSFFYVIFILPIGLVFRVFSDPLRLKLAKDVSKKSSFEQWEHPKESLEEARRQY